MDTNMITRSTETRTAGQQPETHRIFVCEACRHTGSVCHSGYDLITRLRAAIAMAGDAVPDQLEISGTAYMTGCERACSVGYQVSRKTAYLFGDIHPDQDIDDLVAYAEQHRQGCGDPAKLGQVPAAMIVTAASFDPVA